MKRTLLPLLAVAALSAPDLLSRREQSSAQGPAGKLTAEAVRGLELRGIGPASKPGRMADAVFDPRDDKVIYAAHASSGLWKTTDGGNNWKPIFDDHVSYSLGCITLDPKNPDIVWLGTGENQSLRSVSFGDGIYKSADGGKTWKHMGLARSEHIGKILIDPRDSNIIYVAAQGPLWAPGGDRGLYKSTDGGATWKAVLEISENTGITDIAFDPRDPKVIYAAAYQRRRHTGILIGGGPEAGIFKTTDAGATWKKLTNGIPKGDLGRIAVAVSPQKPDIVYALVTASGKDSGFFRSENGGETFVRQSNYKLTDPQYYGEIYPDPHKFERIYSVDMQIQVTNDGGKKFASPGWKGLHVDYHSVTFHAKDPNRLLIGNDGGLYDTKDGGKTWKHFILSTMQFYRVAVDDALPFYNVMGGSQDNGSLHGPSRTLSSVGIRKEDWKSIGGGDGFQARAEPGNPNIIYSTSQNGAISRKGGPGTFTRPKAAGVRWHWDSAYIISPHDPKRLYFGGNILFRTDDRGNSWKTVSPDLTRKLDRDKIPVMGKLWGKDAVARNLFTTPLGVINSVSESPLAEGFLAVGTDDGLVQISEDAGKNWRKIETFPGVPDMAYVSDVHHSPHDAKTVYATFNHYQYGNFKPYVLKSTDHGKTWASIAGDLPDRHPVWSIVEDHGKKDLVFVGTEYGLFFSLDGGKHWVQLKGGAVPAAFRDLEIQKRENDLAGATFGRGFFVLDDYTPLRHLTAENLAKEGVVLPLRKNYRFEQVKGKAASTPNAVEPNLPPGALLTYYLRDGLKSGEKAVLTVTDAGGKTLRQLEGPTTAGLHRVNWDLRVDSEKGTQAPVGTYRVALSKSAGGQMTPLGEPQSFEIIPLPAAGGKGE